MTIRQGMIVGWIYRRNLLVCYVRRFSGKDDDLVQLVTEKCLLSGGPSRTDATAYTYFDHLIEPDWVNREGDVILSKDHADEVGKQIVAFLQTKKGKAMVARPPREGTPAPESGRGNPQRAEIPTKLTRGFSSELNSHMTARISDGGLRNWSLAQMKHENIVMYRVFVDRETHGYSFREIAERRNLTENNCRQIFHRGKALMRVLAGSYPVRMRLDRQEADAA